MKFIGIALVVLAFPFSAQVGKIPYFVPSNEATEFEHVFLMKDDEESLVFLRLINDHRCEQISYFHHPDQELATRIEATYTFNKHHQLILYSGLKQRIIQADSLRFAIEDAQATTMDNPFSNLYFRDHKFYDNRIKAWLKYQPIIQESNDVRLTRAWSQSPLTGENLIQGPCKDPKNLNCLCAALTYDKPTSQEKADAIGKFVIERFDYNRGDTSQNNIRGLVFGKEREAVCEGYSRVYKDLMERLHFKTDYMSGAVRTDVYDIFYSGHSHAWNQTTIDGKTYGLDITWAQNLSSNWYLLPPSDLQITHFDWNEKDGSTNTGDSNMTMYGFMHQPLINPITEGGSKGIKNLDKIEPFQLAQGTFVINFDRKLVVNHVSREELSYPFVKFEGEAQQVATQVIAKSGSVNKKTTTNKLEIQLPEKINNIKVEIQGIGTVHYVVFNGTENEFYQYLIDHRNPVSAYSMAMAFMACAKLNNEIIFNSLKANLSEGITFKSFMKQAKQNHLNEFHYAIFNGCHHQNYDWNEQGKLVPKYHKKNKQGKFENFQGYSFEFSQPHAKEISKIYLNENEDGTYSFYQFGVNRW